MKKVLIVIVLALAILGIGIFMWNTYFSNQNSSEDYQAERTSTENNNTDDTNTSDDNTNTTQEPPAPTIVEEGIGSYSTKIFNPDSARQNNINITCSQLNETVVANGATFSFCETVGPSTTAEGYQKADVFDAKGNKKKGLGGGNCQISTTLYNAVLNTPGLEVTERHKHSNYVPYIQSGLDAAVAYGSYDLKFVNQTGSDIKIKASSNGQSVDITLVKLVQA